MKIALVIAIAIAAAASPPDGRAALFFLFDQTNAAPNDRVTVRTGVTPASFTLTQRVKPFQRPVRLYLVPRNVAAKVHSRFDRRLSFVGSLVPDKNVRGLLTFSVPPLDAGIYTLAYWCPGCARYSHGRTFFVQDPREFVEPYRSRALLRIEAIPACPVTIPNGKSPPGRLPGASWHGNGMLWTSSLTRDGVRTAPSERVRADGSIFDKLGWWTTPPRRRPRISGTRIDAPAEPMRVLAVSLGYSTASSRPNWASAVALPTAGCWRITARVGDVSLTVVTKVVIAGG